MTELTNVKKEDLVVHILNVGHGDAIIIELPRNAQGKRVLGIVDCYKKTKTWEYLNKLKTARNNTIERVDFVCATHPHYDHIAGIESLLKELAGSQDWGKPNEFWDSGFRHNSKTYKDILTTVHDEGISMRRISSGMEWYYGTVRVTALSPSVMLRNRYATYGVDMNNASIVLRLENCEDDAVTVQSKRYQGTTDPDVVREAGNSVVLLGGDAEFDSWARISQEYPCLTASDKHEPLVTKMVNLLNCAVVKVAHHGSMHSSPLEVYERMTPSIAVVSNKQKASGQFSLGGTQQPRNLFPHGLTEIALEEVGATILTTEQEGTVVVAVSPGGNIRHKCMGDNADTPPTPPPEQ